MAGRHFEFFVDVDVIDLGNDRIEELLKVDDIQYELMGKLFDKPSLYIAMKGFDLAMSRSIARTCIDPAHPEDAEALTKYIRVVRGSTICIEA